jgi:predicted RNA-binding protein associated with RNAse of E/G family
VKLFEVMAPLKPLQNLIYISLEIFRRMPHNKNNLSELEAWLYFLASDNPSDILNIVKQYPAFQELYKDIVLFRFQPKEVISMYSEALSIMDRNTVKYMMDEMKAENLRLAEENQRHAEENHKQAKENQRQAEEIRLLKQQLAEYTKRKN